LILTTICKDDLEKATIRAWTNRGNDKYQLMMKISIGLKATEIVKLDSFHFDISNHGVLFQTQEFLAADVYQTVGNF